MPGMQAHRALAYVFWHWTRPTVDADRYESMLRAFQESLLANAPAGYRAGAVFRHGSAAWLPGRDGCYVDWYRIDGSAALDALNDAAISTACRASHDAAAGLAAGGTAGLYELRRGAVAPGEVRAATWFSKPAAMTYQALESDLADRLPGGGVELWCRRMTLGPTPEMCVLAASAVALPDAYGAASVPMESIWFAAARSASATRVHGDAS